MQAKGKKLLRTGICLAALFMLWTMLILTVDVQNAGQAGTPIGFAGLNGWFHQLTGVHMWLYAITDWLGLIPVFVCLGFAVLGLAQLFRRKSLAKVDFDIILLGVYFVLVVLLYLLFEMFPLNYRPVLIDGRLESSYPSSTTLLVMSVMPAFAFQTNCRLQNTGIQKAVYLFAVIFSAGMVAGRLVSGVHWLTDIIGSVLLSTALFCMYKAAVILYCRGQQSIRRFSRGIQ